jgi:hypothetical protein
MDVSGPLARIPKPLTECLPLVIEPWIYKSLTGMSFRASCAVFGAFRTPYACTYKRRTLVVVKFSSRRYATHRDAQIYQQPGVGSSSLLSQALDQKERGPRREDSVGPFQLGLSRPSFDNGTAKKWSELSPKGKGQSLNSVFAATNLSRIL